MAKVLVVDDEQYIREMYLDELTEDGHAVATLASGLNLRESLDSLQPDVMVLDIMLGGDNGLNLLQEIRSDNYKLPVILCSANDSGKSDPRSLAAEYYVMKSFDLSELKKRVNQAVNGINCRPISRN
ncbi:MAG: response regulator [Deltaproteobacteria bacterium]|nr:response regulator [Deltaproteobacteria bacterium]